MKSQTHSFHAKTPRRSLNLVVTFILAALLVLLIVLYAGKDSHPKQYELKIMELGSESMLAHSTSKELGYGEILLIYDENMVVEDINGQVIDFVELSPEDRIRVTILPREKDPEYDRYLDPVVDKIILLPDDSDDYV